MKRFTFLAVFLFTMSCFAQTAKLKFMPGLGEVPNGYYTEFSLTINNKAYNVKDSTTQKIRLNKKGFDKCSAIIGQDTLHFLAKFRKGETYIVKPGCCCAFFTLTPENNPQRGTVSFKNNTTENMVLIAAEANIEKVGPGEEKTTYTYESAMCMFKPCSILVAKAAYDDPKYNYSNDDRDYDTLWKEQKKYVVNFTWFHFMHGEKISVELNESTGKITLQPDGYLRPEEYEKFWFFDE